MRQQPDEVGSLGIVMVGKGDNYWDAQQKQPTTNPYNCKASLTSESERREGGGERERERERESQCCQHLEIEASWMVNVLASSLDDT